MLDESTTARTSVSSCARVSNSSPYAVQNLAEGCKRNGELDREIFYSIVKALTGFLEGKSLDGSIRNETILPGQLNKVNMGRGL